MNNLVSKYVYIALLLTAHVRASTLTLTPAGMAQGFVLSTFASGFPTFLDSGGHTTGPLGIAFPVSGGVLVTDSSGNVRRFASDTDGQLASSATVGQTYATANVSGLAVSGGKVYMAQPSSAQVVQVNDDGTFNQNIVALQHATGVATNPLTGHLYVSGFDPTAGSGYTNAIFEVDPVGHSATRFAAISPGNSNAGPDGVTVSPDGSVVFSAIVGTGHVLGFNTVTHSLIFDSGFISNAIDGIAIGAGALAGNLFVNTNDGMVIEITISTMAQTLIASGGTRGDFVTVDPSGRSVLLTQTSDLVRLTAPAGSGFGSAVPEAALGLPTGLAVLGLLAVSRKLRRGDCIGKIDSRQVKHHTTPPLAPAPPRDPASE